MEAISTVEEKTRASGREADAPDGDKKGHRAARIRGPSPTGSHAMPLDGLDDWCLVSPGTQEGGQLSAEGAAAPAPAPPPASAARTRLAFAERRLPAAAELKEWVDVLEAARRAGDTVGPTAAAIASRAAPMLGLSLWHPDRARVDGALARLAALLDPVRLEAELQEARDLGEEACASICWRATLARRVVARLVDLRRARDGPSPAAEHGDGGWAKSPANDRLAAAAAVALTAGVRLGAEVVRGSGAAAAEVWRLTAPARAEVARAAAAQAALTADYGRAQAARLVYVGRRRLAHLIAPPPPTDLLSPRGLSPRRSLQRHPRAHREGALD